MAPSPKISLALGWNSKPMRTLAHQRAPAKSVEMSLDAADTSVRATKTGD
jgi:hypothetical protein